MTPEQRIDRALGVRALHAGVLREEMFADLSTEHGGFFWWEPVPFEQRVLLSDYLYVAASAIRDHLATAALHHCDARQALDAEAARWTERFRDGRGDGVPVPHTLGDEAQTVRLGAHVAGFFRALASAVDCATAGVVGVLALPVPVQKAEFKRVWRDHLVPIAQRNPTDERTRRISAAATACMNAMEDAGPEGWLWWLLRTRNMLAHRAPRMRTFEAVREQNELGVPTVNIVFRLWRKPLLPEMEAWVASGGPSEALLSEDAWLTMARLQKSTNDMLDAWALALVELWRWRRTNADGGMQPWERQWDDFAERDEDFEGYFPGSRPIAPDKMLVSATHTKRIRAALLDGERRSAWDAFLEQRRKTK